MAINIFRLSRPSCLTTIILIFSSFFMVSCIQETEPKRETSASLPPVEVTVAKVVPQAASRQIELVGTVQATIKAEIAAKITGNISRLPVSLGTSVQKGDLLVEISAGEISAQLQEAKAHLTQAERNLAREKKLLKRNAATPERVKSLEDQVRIAKASYDQAYTMLDYTKITAPFSGVITRKQASVGDLATPGKILLHLEAQEKLEIATDIPEAMMQVVKMGDLLPVAIAAIDKTVEGRVIELSPTADPQSRSAPVTLSIEHDPLVRSGQFARVLLSLSDKTTLTVPLSAVTQQGQLEKVFVVEENLAKLRIVRTGAEILQGAGDQLTEVLSGLEEGETVITNGPDNLLNGQPVVIN